jgi:hypothetical protein
MAHKGREYFVIRYACIYEFVPLLDLVASVKPGDNLCIYILFLIIQRDQSLYHVPSPAVFQVLPDIDINMPEEGAITPPGVLGVVGVGDQSPVVVGAESNIYSVILWVLPY